MSRKILVTGGGGFLGGNIIRESNPDIEILSIDVREQMYSRKKLQTEILDLTNLTALVQTIEKYKPDTIIHTAAISDIDYCEAHQDIAEKVNVDVTQVIAEYCKENEIRMIQFSSDSVFDGKKGNYKEEDPPSPLHYYGKTKVSGEQIVSGRLKKWNIIRPSLIMGLPAGESGNSFLLRMITTLKGGGKVFFPIEEIRTPVDVVTLSRSVLELALSEKNGFFHLSGNTVLNRFEMAIRICDFFGYDKNLVEQKKPFVLTGRATRPADVSLDNSKAQKMLATPMKSLTDGLKLIINSKEGRE